ncbi:MAG TPA: Rrf2 family transcriptional regulator [Bacteroidota bacterium]|jgi:Rrf2 family protein|nr:Rrf2 family transcriptional regulator [Bacteroidota bacterium]
MSIIFSRQCEYAIQAVLYLALHPQNEKTSIRELTKVLKIPYHFLAKILQKLTHKGLLHSQKGLAGGFSLARPAANITLFEIIEAIDGNGLMHNCILGFPECSESDPCALHDQWLKSRDGIYQLLANDTINHLASRMKKPQYLTEILQTGCP